MKNSSLDQPAYGIGAVARLTGIPLNTLRAWERRYALVTPTRGDGNQRQYVRNDVVRLQLIKQLVDRGHAISTLAGLDQDALRERLQLHCDTPDTPGAGTSAVRVLLYGDALPYLVDAWREDLAPLEIVGTHASYGDFERQAFEEHPDVLVLEWPSLDPEAPPRMSALRSRVGAERIVVVYGFATQAVVKRLQRDGVVALRAPVTAAALRAACRQETSPKSAIPAAMTAAAVDTPVPLRRFDPKALAAVASLPTGIRCECPHHLADLLFRVTAFETYSADCESRSERDAALHGYLHRAAGQARVILEEALAYLIQCEDINIGV